MKTFHDPNVLALKQTDLVAIIEQGDVVTPNQIILQNALAFHGPVVCLVSCAGGLDGYWLRADWNFPIPEGAVVRFMETPQGKIGGIIGAIVTIIVAIVAPPLLGVTGLLGTLLSAGIMIAGSLLMGALFGAQQANGDTGTPDTVYSLSRSNRYRPGEPFAERFGRRQFFPDVAMSYARFEGNDQYLYLLLVVGVGYYGPITPTVGKTLLSDYSGVTMNTVVPGARPTICPNVVWTSTEVSGQEIDVDWITFVVNPRNTVIYSIEWDVTFPALVGYTDEGDRYNVTVTVAIQVRTIDDYGNATGEWVSIGKIVRNYTGMAYIAIFLLDNFTTVNNSGDIVNADYTYSYVDSYTEKFSAASKDPLRYTRSFDVPSGPGRYEMRIRRLNKSSGSSRVTDKVYFAGLKGIGGKHPVVDGVTMWEAKILATDQMSGDSATKIQLETTRLLHPVTATGFGGERVATRSIVDACAHIVTSDNGGRFSSSILAWDVLKELRDEFAAKNYWFDHAFTSRTSVMDACSTAAACALAVPYTPGGLFCIAANTLQTAYGTPFTDDDYDPDSFKISTSFRKADSFTCVRVKYYDTLTAQEESVDCYEIGGGTANPKEITLNGCSVRQHAYEIGMILYRDMVKSTVTVEFTTGLKGNLPSLFSWIPVASTAANYNQTGVIAAIEAGGVVWTSEPLDFGDESSGWMLLVLPDGSNAGPYTVTPTTYTHKHNCSLPSGIATIRADRYGTKYIFGPASTSKRVIRVMAIAPEGRDKITITGQAVDESIYGAVGIAPGYAGGVLDIDPLYSLSAEITNYDDGIVSVKLLWTGSAPSYKIEVDYGSGYTTVDGEYTGYSIVVSSANILGVFKVTPYVDDAPVESQALTAPYRIIPPPTALTVSANTDGAIVVAFGAVANANSYNILVKVDGNQVLAAASTATSHTFAAYQVTNAGGPWQTFSVAVAAIVGGELGYYDEVAVNAPALPATTFTSNSLITGGVVLAWGAVANATGYKLYLGDTASFNPAAGGGTLVYAGSNPTATVPLDLTAPYEYHFKVAGTSPYRTDAADLSFSADLEISAAAPGSLPAPTNLALAQLLANGATLTWDIVTGATGYKVYRGSIEDFDPETEGVLVYTGTGNSATVSLNLTTPYAYHFKVAGTDASHQAVVNLVFSDDLEVSG